MLLLGPAEPPTVSVNRNSTVGVLYYDLRNDVLGDAQLSTDVHLSLSVDTNNRQDMVLVRETSIP